MRKCMEHFTSLLNARDTCMYVRTYEENEFIKDVVDIVQGKAPFRFNDASDKAKVYVYSRFEGLYLLDMFDPSAYDRREYIRDVNNLNKLFKFIQKQSCCQDAIDDTDSFEDLLTGKNEEETKDEAAPNAQSISVFIIKDLHMFFDKETIRALRDLKEEYDELSYCPIVVTSPVTEIPCELEKLFTYFEYENMSKEDFKQILYANASESGYSDEEIDAICDACTGLTYREMLRSFSHSVAVHEGIDIKMIHDEKVQIVKKSGALDYLHPTMTIEDTGGYENLKTWIREMKVALSPEAKDFGIAQPKGAMLVGLPGNGKTMTAEIIANYLEVPLLQLDLAKIMGSFVGQSERQIANALRIVKACAPCVMLIDEAEKLFGGYQSSASTDSGTLSRVLAQLLQFLQEDNTGVITIMTSNNVFELPPELLRSGRLDAQWYFGFPSTEERKEILDIYLKKNRLEVTSNIFNYIIRATKNYSGAEIKEIVKNLLIKSYFRQKQEGKEPERVIIAEDAKAAIAAVVPVYQTSKEKVDLFVEMAKGRYRIASAAEEAA